MQIVTLLFLPLILFAQANINIIEYDNYAKVDVSDTYIQGSDQTSTSAQEGCLKHIKKIASKSGYTKIYSKKIVKNRKLESSYIEAISNNLVKPMGDATIQTINDNGITKIKCSASYKIEIIDKNNSKFKKIFYPNKTNMLVSKEKYTYRQAKEFCAKNDKTLPSLSYLLSKQTTYPIRSNNGYVYYIKRYMIEYMPKDTKVMFWSSDTDKYMSNKIKVLDFSINPRVSKKIANTQGDELYTMCVGR